MTTPSQDRGIWWSKAFLCTPVSLHEAIRDLLTEGQTLEEGNCPSCQEPVESKLSPRWVLYVCGACGYRMDVAREPDALTPE